MYTACIAVNLIKVCQVETFIVSDLSLFSTIDKNAKVYKKVESRCTNKVQFLHNTH